MLSNNNMYYRSLDSYLATPQPRIENNLIKRQTATISEREDEMKKQIETKNIFYGGGDLNDRFDKLENNLMNLLDRKLELLETKIKLEDLKQDEKINMTDSDSDDEESDDDENDDIFDRPSESEDEESEDEDEKHLKAKREKRRQYLKNYHQKYYLKNKQKKLKSKL